MNGPLSSSPLTSGESSDPLLQNLNDIVSEPPVKNDALAKKEEKSLFDSNQERRKDQVQWHIHIVLLIILWALGVVIVVIVLIRVSHLLLPIDKLWLDKDQISTIDTLLQILVGSTVGSVAMKYLNKNMDME